MNAYEFIIKMRDHASSDLRKLASSLGMAQNNAYGFNSGLNATESTSQRLAGSMGKLGSVLAKVFAVGAIFAFTNKVIDARSEYEKFEAVLTNTFQSADVGKSALNMLTNFAKETPFQLNDLTGSFVKLVNRGFNPTKTELQSLGDLASSQGKGFDQLTEGILDAQTGEFERLKEFGINASKQGNLVSLSFKGVTKSVNNNQKAIGDAILEYGKMTGVAGSMDAIAGTMGGQISNLKDKWDGFLVSVGGQSGEIFASVIGMLSSGLETISGYIPYIYSYFNALWQTISPVVNTIREFLKSTLGFESAGSIVQTFGNIMTGVLMGIDYLVKGALSPLGGIVLGVAGAWLVLTNATWLYNGALGVFNSLMAVNPITWIIVGIVALIGVIGMVTKYTSGWGESWKHTVNGASYVWDTYTSYVKANFNSVVQVLMMGIDKIKLGWYSFKEAVGIGNSSENLKMIAGINAGIDARKKSIVDGYKEISTNAAKAKKEFSQVGISVDTKGISKDFNALKSKFSVSGETQKGDGGAAYDNWRAKNMQGAGAGAGGAKGKAKSADGIVSGGSKMTTINITIQKLQDDTKIYVTNTEQGLSNLGDKVQEVLLRAVNSVNQMQTG